MPALIEIRDLKFKYQDAPHGFFLPFFHLAEREALFLEGPSGSGKSTFLQIIAGVLRPLAGEINFSGKNIAGLSFRELDRLRGDHMGYIFQIFNLIPYLSVEENIVLPLNFSKLKKSRLADTPSNEAARLASALGLPHSSLTKKVSDLSVGEQQRVAAARALLGRPALILADEPTSALDSERCASFLELLFREAERSESALLFVSHDQRLKSHFKRVENWQNLIRETA